MRSSSRTGNNTGHERLQKLLLDSIPEILVVLAGKVRRSPGIHGGVSPSILILETWQIDLKIRTIGMRQLGSAIKINLVNVKVRTHRDLSFLERSLIGVDKARLDHNIEDSSDLGIVIFLCPSPCRLANSHKLDHEAR
ncbi:hypothetical protein Tco_1236119 [Tanacetum coccineum]|uniref:Uncharacterized protein n=1 Tax=Tanacetum coccineum TaxID=301880 RepID=A0ABQ4Z4Q6_9ASTR